MAKNSNLHAAKAAKNDEFYTQLTDIEKEMSHYREHFQDKIIFCNCDDPDWSNFWRYFHLNFGFLGLKKLIATHYDPVQPTYKLEYEGGDDYNIKAGVKSDLTQNGDFRSPECIELLQESDIVVTNPPFSLFREYVAQLMEYGKNFIIIGNMNCLTYKEFFPLIKDDKVWPGVNEKGGTRKGNSLCFGVAGKDELVQVSAWWFTNLDHAKRHEPLTIWRKYYDDPSLYPKYDNYDAINVDKTSDIPCDYDGVMGVPISFLDKYCPEQFEIVGLAPERLASDESKLQIKRYLNAVQHKKDGSTCGGNKVNDGPVIVHDVQPSKFPYYTSETVPGKYLEVLYARILIRRRHNNG